MLFWTKRHILHNQWMRLCFTNGKWNPYNHLKFCIIFLAKNCSVWWLMLFIFRREAKVYYPSRCAIFFFPLKEIGPNLDLNSYILFCGQGWPGICWAFLLRYKMPRSWIVLNLYNNEFLHSVSLHFIYCWSPLSS